MDDDIAFYFEIGSNRRKDAQRFFRKVAEKVPRRIIRTFCDGGIKMFNDDFVFHINRRRGVEHHTARRIDNPDNRVQIGVQSIQLCFHRVQRRFAAVQVGGVSIGNQCRFPVERIGLIFF